MRFIQLVTIAMDAEQLTFLTEVVLLLQKQGLAPSLHSSVGGQEETLSLLSSPSFLGTAGWRQ